MFLSIICLTCNPTLRAIRVRQRELNRDVSAYLAASTWSPWLAMWSGARPFLVLAEIGAPLWSIMSTTFSCPDLAAQWSGVSPALVFDSRWAPLSKSRATMLAVPHLAATWRGVMLCWKNKGIVKTQFCMKDWHNCTMKIGLPSCWSNRYMTRPVDNPINYFSA